VQFHTRASFEAKELTHPAYEKLRSPGTPKAEQEAAARFQREVSAKVPVPSGVTEIPDYRCTLGGTHADKDHLLRDRQ
jgi:hypothetical protein